MFQKHYYKANPKHCVVLPHTLQYTFLRYVVIFLTRPQCFYHLRNLTIIWGCPYSNLPVSVYHFLTVFWSQNPDKVQITFGCYASFSLEWLVAYILVCVSFSSLCFTPGLGGLSGRRASFRICVFASFWCGLPFYPRNFPKPEC